MTIKLAVFDLAGTTLADDDAVAKAFKNAFAVYGFEVNEENINPLMGYKKPLAIQIMLDKLGEEPSEELVADIHREFEISMLEHYENSPDVKPLPGAENTLQHLKDKGIRIALNTGFSRSIADTILRRLQWMEKGLVDDYIASDEVEAGRPQPFMIQTLMKRAGIDDAKEVIKIGDTEVDINEGRNAGCAMVVAVTTGAFTRDQLAPYNPDYIIDELSQLKTLIN